MLYWLGCTTVESHTVWSLFVFFRLLGNVDFGKCIERNWIVCGLCGNIFGICGTIRNSIQLTIGSLFGRKNLRKSM